MRAPRACAPRVSSEVRSMVGLVSATDTSEGSVRFETGRASP
jgi:hypothetical protein